MFEFGDFGGATVAPTVSPTASPTASPTVAPTVAPTVSPTPSPSPAPTTSSWVSRGCYFDGQGGRALVNELTGLVAGGFNNMTHAGCLAVCKGFGYSHCGLEWHGECWGGNTIAGTNAAAPDADCNMPCLGNAAEFCGSDNRLNMFEYVTVVAPTQSPSPSANATTVAPTVAPTVEPTVSPSANATVSPTASANATTSANTTTLAPSPSANATTSANTTTLAPSPSANATTSANTTTSAPVPTATPTGWTALGCYYDQRGGRALTNDQTFLIPGGGANVTHENCQAACRAGGFYYSGTEYAQECRCGNAVRFQNGPAPAADCNMACTGDRTTICGSGDRMTMFGFGTANGTDGSVTFPKSVVPANWTYQGCYIDGVAGRILPVELPASTNNTQSNCINACAAQNYTIAGMQFGEQCFCGNAIYNGGNKTTESQCSMPCTGQPFEMCGDANRFTIFSKGEPTAYKPPAPIAKSGNWTYLGCYSDNPDKRALHWSIPISETNSAEVCLQQCQKFGYMTGGMQYANECSCGDWPDLAATGSIPMPEADCFMPCPGNATQICGGALRFSLYNWTGPALYEWGAPTGSDQGQYQYILGGIVIPLIATLGIDNKVMFLEKLGTGPPNSTGAYELDPATLTFRTLHGIKTDLFCATGVTLPDKAGRQLNVGGWSADSLYGVRLYTPGGNNDWEEDYTKVALQRGRWYPTAMTMANGSIVVVGGQIGSNGPPEPTLEVMPKPPGGRYLFMDWLLRTDPNNLYPYMWVLPGGGIFIQYWNEARILDPVTFDTRTILPNAPGSVANAQAGRTYPMEGTAVMLPQYAPYTDPVTILICGGAEAWGKSVDNCVSIQPEVANPTWTIERMPSPRVMTNMVALPDGTFMIIGGARQGVAGFGLASDPNEEAVLYDPTKPITKRMSRMGKSNIARMYHSETILLPDGSILVSGSDPQDFIHPQEYRIERFNPPYMQKGWAKPTFSLTAAARGNWDYGGSYGITVNAGGNIRIALMGAVSATHGASMGQRTYFPAISCGGGACTIQAPPNANVCVPGWYQIYVVSDGMPSDGQWVRIGGDPANLGEWPNFPGTFTAPGRG